MIGPGDETLWPLLVFAGLAVATAWASSGLPGSAALRELLAGVEDDDRK